MMAAVHFPSNPNFKFDDAMDLSSDLNRGADDEDIDIDIDFRDVQNPEAADEEMTEEIDESAMPVDSNRHMQPMPDPLDTPMDDEIGASLELDSGQQEQGQSSENDHDTAEDISEEDLIDDQENIDTGIQANQEPTDKLAGEEPEDVFALSKSPGTMQEMARGASDLAAATNTTYSIESEETDVRLTPPPHSPLRDTSFDQPNPKSQPTKQEGLGDQAKHTESQHLEDINGVRGVLETKTDETAPGQRLAGSILSETENGHNETNEIASTADVPTNDVRSGPLRTVIVMYQDEEVSLFPPWTDDTESAPAYLLSNESLAHGGALNLLSACREVLAESVDELEELEISIPDLGLKINEVSGIAIRQRV